MTTYSLCPAPNYRSLTLAGAPNAGGKLYTYISGTTTNQATYTSSTGGVLNANPVIFDANGFANVWLDSSLTYTLLETDSAGTTIRTQDVISNAAGATGAAGTFACAAAGGTVDAITATYSPVLTLADKTMCAIVSSGANTITNPTFAPDGLTAHTVTKLGGTALVAGDIGPALTVHILEYNLANTRWELLNPAKTPGTSLSFTDVTTNNASTSVHGLMPKLSNSATLYFDSLGTQTNPALNAVLTGYSSGAGTVASTDTVLGAIQKLNGNAVGGITQIATASPSGVATSDATSIPQTYRALLMTWTGLSSDTATRKLIFKMDYGSGVADEATFQGFKNLAGTVTGYATGGNNLSIILGAENAASAAQTTSGFFTIENYQTNGPKVINGRHLDGTGVVKTVQGCITTTGGIITIRSMWDNTGNFDAGSWTLYGLN